MSQWQAVIVVIGVLAWWLSPATSLGDLSRREAVRRQLAPGAVRVLTNQDAPEPLPGSRSSPVSDVPAGDTGDAAKPAATAERPEEKPAAQAHDEAWWRARVTAAKEAAEHDQLLADAMQSRINALTNDVMARDDPAQRAVLEAQRLRALAELDRLNRMVTSDRKAIEAVSEDARKQGVPPGWIR